MKSRFKMLLTRQSLSEGRAQPEEIHDGLQPL